MFSRGTDDQVCMVPQPAGDRLGQGTDGRERGEKVVGGSSSGWEGGGGVGGEKGEGLMSYFKNKQSTGSDDGLKAGEEGEAEGQIMQDSALRHRRHGR